MKINVRVSITRRRRRRWLRSGALVTHVRWVVNFRDPKTGQRRQVFCERQNEAVDVRNDLLTSIGTGTYSQSKSDTTVADVVAHWLDHRRLSVKSVTWKGYRQATKYVIGPLLAGTAKQRKHYTERGEKTPGAELIDMLGPLRVADLSTLDIRRWYKRLADQVSSHTANRARSILKAALALAAEDFGARIPAQPLNLGRFRAKPKKSILTPGQVGMLLRGASEDWQKGIYYAFPFLTGVRPSEQLALLWDDVDFEAGTITIRRMQERSGKMCELTKTVAGLRELPMPPLLRSMLLDWRVRCPRLDGQLHRVFPAIGHVEPWSGLRRLGGGALHYANFRNRFWRPVFIRLGLPYVTPHSARHAFISTLQAAGVEVGLVAKLAGHSNAGITLSHYTQAVRGGEMAMSALENAFMNPRVNATRAF